MKGTELRSRYLDYFKQRGHQVVPSASLIPQGDPSLLFTSAGMVPFKPYFLGVKKDLSRAASCQKSFRTTDIERVGTTIRHLTFFEMLGNFSFGDYFKAEAIEWCWNFLTAEAGLDPKRLYVSIYKDDPEAAELWKKHNLANPITPLGEDSNFWTMGPTGPCGPCSEVYYDRGAEHGCGQKTCGVGCDCDRYLEVWNLVFTQFDRQEDGRLEPLPRKNIDTGMGLERLALVVQGKKSPFETDLFWPVMEKASEILHALPGQTQENKLIFRVLGDHSRAAAFLVAEGVLPSNEGRGYVLRRLIRRALSQGGRLMKFKRPFVHELSSEAARLFGPVYPELAKNLPTIEETIRQEETTFLATLESGEARLEEIIAKRPKVLSGEEAFKLYDTYGFPLELTKERLAVEGIPVDEKGYEAAREKAKEVARQGWKGSGERAAYNYQGLLDQTGLSVFKGYETLSAKATVKAIGSGQATLGKLLKGESGEVILDETPFYPEGGGQVGDVGTLEGQGFKAEVLDTFQPLKGLIVHKVRVTSGELRPGSAVTAQVDAAKRERTMCHHTGTHLLNAALREVFGPQVRQAGSLVAPDKLRFDYTLPRSPSAEELKRVEDLVNHAIDHDYPVQVQQRSSSEVEALDAVTLVGEDYGEKPRFVLVGPHGWEQPKERFSLELCGGTHVHHTMQIRLFKIVKESSVSAGTRRIEAVAGPAAVDQLYGYEERARSMAKKLQVPAEELEKKLDSMIRAERELKDEIAALKQKLLAGGSLSQKREERELPGGVKLVAQSLEGIDINSLRGLSDKTQKELGSGAVFLASIEDGKIAFVLSFSSDLKAKGFHAGNAAGALAKTLEGKAGGRPDFAQGGGRQTKSFPEIVDDLSKLIAAK